MKITWLGHSCFKITSNEESIILDPYKDGYVDGLKPLREKANIVLCSHGHNDHNAIETITIEKKDIHMKVTTIDSYHDDKQGTLRGMNTIHIIDDGTIKVAHLGDLGCELNEKQIKQLMNVDVLLIPIGGFFTINSKQAKDIVEQLNPKITIPMHYSGKGFGYHVLETVDCFTQYFEEVLNCESNSIVVEDTNSKIVVLKY